MINGIFHIEVYKFCTQNVESCHLENDDVKICFRLFGSCFVFAFGVFINGTHLSES